MGIDTVWFKKKKKILFTLNMFLIHKVYFIKKIVIQMKNKGRKE